jgi:Ca2+/Na+ antiporter
LSDGQLALTLRSATFQPPGDPRALGVPLGAVQVRSVISGLAAPSWGAVLEWLGAVTLGWLAVRGALGQAGKAPADRVSGSGSWLSALGSRFAAEWVLLVGSLLVAGAALLDPPRWAFGARAALVACALAYPLALGVRRGLAELAGRLLVPLDGVSLGWLSLFVVISFALRYGGRLYPASMPGDIGFHVNRFNDAIWGLIYIISVNRGVEFPYPPGPYLLVAPLTLLGLEPRTLLQIGAALADAVSAALVYAIAARVTTQRTALLAAGLYVFTAATFMASWWSFDTHIYTQFLHLLVVAYLVVLFGTRKQERGDGKKAGGQAGMLVILIALVFLGHFGFLINTALMLGLAVAGVWVLSWRGVAWAQGERWPLTLALAGAGAFAAIFFYTAYIPLFLGQLETARDGGLSAVAGRAPVSRAVMWQGLWRDGLIVHFGLFPLLLMPWGVLLLGREARREIGLGPQRVALGLMLASLTVALLFALFPFVSGATNSPRWMLFIAWVVAVGAAIGASALWRRGWWGRLLMLGMGAAVLLNTAWIWLGPMLWRIRPPEPF